MNAKQKKHMQNLLRRRARLVERITGYRHDGNPEPARRELSALNYAIRVIENCDAAGILDDVS